MYFSVKTFCLNKNKKNLLALCVTSLGKLFQSEISSGLQAARLQSYSKYVVQRLFYGKEAQTWLVSKL